MANNNNQEDINQEDDIVIMESTDSEIVQVGFDIEKAKENEEKQQRTNKVRKIKNKIAIDPLLIQIVIALIVCAVVTVSGLMEIETIDQNIKNERAQQIQKKAQEISIIIENKVKYIQNSFKSIKINNLKNSNSFANKIYPGSSIEYFNLPFNNFKIVDDPVKGKVFLDLLLQVKNSKANNISSLEIINANSKNASIIFAKVIINKDKEATGVAVVILPIEYKNELINHLNVKKGSIIIKQGKLIIAKLINPKINAQNSLTKIVAIKNTHWKIEYSNLILKTKIDFVNAIMTHWLITVYAIISFLSLLFSLYITYKYIRKLKLSTINNATTKLESNLLNSKESISKLGINKSEILIDRTTKGESLLNESEHEKNINTEIFTDYGIRGEYGKQIDAKLMTKFAHAIAQEMDNLETNKITIGYDARNSSEILYQGLIEGFKNYPIKIIDLGLSTLPVIYYCATTQTNGCSLMVTAGSSSAEINGIKLILNNEIISKEKLKLFSEVEEIIGKEKYQIEKQDINYLYINSITEQFNYNKTLKVVIDTSNGVTSLIIIDLLKLLGCNVIPINKEIDGSFPNHVPSTTKPENFTVLAEKVKQESADVGIIFNGDGSSLGIISSSGDIIWADRLLMLLARNILEENVGAKIIYDVKCTSDLHEWIIKYQGEPEISPSGYSAIKQRMDMNKALLAGEFSGHFFLATHANGLDDGFYIAATICQIIANYKSSSDNLFKEIPEKISTPEILIGVQPGQLNEIIEKIISQKEEFLPAGIIIIDGIRVEYEDGWGLVRASRTSSALCLRFEAESPQVLQRIAEKFKEVILSVVFVKFPY
jgi:phosphomannomutase